MSDAETIRGAVYRTIEAVNDGLPDEQLLRRSDDLVLLGKDASLDSMGFVNFIVALEGELERALGRDLSIVDLLNMQGDDGDAFVTVADLIRVFAERLE